MTRLFAAVRVSAQSGRYVTGWTLAASFVLSFTVMAPSVAGTSVQTALTGAATWLCVAAALGAVAVLERRLATRARGIVVLCGVALIAATRPLLVDAWASALGAAPPAEWQLPFRTLTNAITWLVVFTAIAILVDAVRSLRTVNALLRAAAEEQARIDRLTAAFDARAREAVVAAVDRLSVGLAALAGHREGRAGPPAADDVRAFASGRVRAASHALSDLAGRALDGDAFDVSPSVPLPPAHVALVSVPPRWVVTVLYAACLLPFAIRAVPVAEFASGGVLALAGGVLADAGSRRRRVRRRARVFVAASLLCAVALSVASILYGAPASRAVVPGVAYALIAIGAGACAGTLRALRVEQRRLSGAVAAAQRQGRAGTAPARDGLTTAAELLHRDVQGRCAVFALEHPHPTSADRARLVDEITRTLGQVGAVFAREARTEPVSLDGVAQTWGRVIELDIDVSPAARAALDAGSAAARDAYDVVAEGVLNAVKHSEQRRAEVALDVVATGAGAALRVRVRSYGPLPAGAQLRPGAHVARIGALLSAAPDGAVLEATIALPMSQSGAIVASAEHPL